MRTKTRDAQTGAQIRLAGGDVLSFAESGVPDGTRVEVADLFYNVPARLKFLKNARAEAAYISDYVSRMIMARPDVAFRLTQSGKSVYRSAGDGNFLNAVYCVYGAEVMPHLKSIEYDDGYVNLSGCAGTEQIGRANRTAQTFFINGRYIKSQKLSFALQRLRCAANDGQVPLLRRFDCNQRSGDRRQRPPEQARRALQAGRARRAFAPVCDAKRAQ